MTENIAGKVKDAFEDIACDRKTLIKILSVVLILLLAVILRIHDENKADITIEEADTAAETEYEDSSSAVVTKIYVDIGGAVENPGVYEVSEDTRLFQVIEMAGGLTEDADADQVNRASFVEDGQKIIIPEEGSEDTAGIMSEHNGVSAAADTGLININTATADELMTLSGIGEVMAQRIIEYRTSNPFKSKEDIMSVDGIGSKTYEKIKDSITA